MGLINPVQVTERLEQIVDAVDLPVIADFDAGYGNVLNALHIEEFRARRRRGISHRTKSFPNGVVIWRAKPWYRRKI